LPVPNSGAHRFLISAKPQHFIQQLDCTSGAIERVKSLFRHDLMFGDVCISERLKSAWSRVSFLRHTLALGVDNSETEKPAVVYRDGYCTLDPMTGHSQNRDIPWDQGLIGITALFRNHTAQKTNRTKPEHSSWNNPELEDSQIAKPLLRHG
jgi:hypothetical protein